MSVPLSESSHEQLRKEYRPFLADNSVLPFYPKVTQQLLDFVEFPESCPVAADRIPEMLEYTRTEAHVSEAEDNKRKSLLYTGTDFEPAEFTRHVELIDIKDCLVNTNAEQVTPKNIKHQLVAVVGRNSSSYEVAGFTYTMPEGIKMTTDEYDYNALYMDSNLAIGLVYNGVVKAVAGGYINQADSNVTILQLQGLLGALTDTRQRFKSGLYSGFDWRMSLINAWQHIGKQLGSSEISITGTIAHPLSSVDDVPKYMKGYDKPAEQLGFTFDVQTGYWKKPL